MEWLHGPCHGGGRGQAEAVWVSHLGAPWSAKGLGTSLELGRAPCGRGLGGCGVQATSSPCLLSLVLALCSHRVWCPSGQCRAVPGPAGCRSRSLEHRKQDGTLGPSCLSRA